MTETETSPVLYSAERPEWLNEFCSLPEMQRLKHVGMNCVRTTEEFFSPSIGRKSSFSTKSFNSIF